MERTHILIAAAATVAASWFVLTWMRDQNEADAPTLPTFEPDITETIMGTIRQTFGTWKPPAKYAGTIAGTEAALNLPADMLARLLYQECRWREDIITGRTTSPAGALGIAQFMPATAAELGIDPLDPAQAIPAAGRYLKTLYLRFGTWTEALAAYNWGQGNVARKGIDAAPLETRNYYSQILADVNAANGTSYA